MTWYWNICEVKGQGGHGRIPSPNSIIILGKNNTYLKETTWGLNIRPLSRQALSNPGCFVRAWPMSVLFLAVPLPQANSSSLSSAPPQIPVPTVYVTRYLASGLTQMARCNFTPTIWENKHSSSDLLDFSGFRALSQACTFVMIFMKLCRRFELRAHKCGTVYGWTLLVYLLHMPT